MAARHIRRRPGAASTVAARHYLLTALFAALCALAGCAGAGSRSIVAGDALFGDVVLHSFQGGAGSIVFEDGTALYVMAPHGVFMSRVSSATMERIAAAMREADFFAVPGVLHNPHQYDASSVEVFVATSARLHWSSNYAVDDARHRRAHEATRIRSGGGPLTPLSPEALDAVVAAYVARSRSPARAEAARRWLAAVRPLLARPGLRE